MPLFGPNYLNICILQLIRDNTVLNITGQCLMYSLLTSLSPASSQLRPGCQADRQLLQNWVTLRTRDRGYGGGAHVTHRVTVGGRAPGFHGVHTDLGLQPVPPVGVQHRGGQQRGEQRQADGVLQSYLLVNGISLTNMS